MSPPSRQVSPPKTASEICLAGAHLAKEWACLDFPLLPLSIHQTKIFKKKKTKKRLALISQLQTNPNCRKSPKLLCIIDRYNADLPQSLPLALNTLPPPPPCLVAGLLLFLPCRWPPRLSLRIHLDLAPAVFGWRVQRVQAQICIRRLGEGDSQ